MKYQTISLFAAKGTICYVTVATVTFSPISYSASTGWLKVNINGPVCFGAKDDACGRFTLQFTGDIISLKLVHVSGSLSTSRAAAGGNWGYRSNKIGILITGVENVVGLPENYTAFEPYTMEGYTGRSPELVFPNFSAPFTAPRGMEARIWFVEDLGNFSENDNSGVSCADVYLFYI